MKEEIPGIYIFSGSRDKTIKLWDTLNGQCLHTFVSKKKKEKRV